MKKKEERSLAYASIFLSSTDCRSVTLDRYFAGLASKNLTQELLDKIRDVLASVLKRAIRHGLLVKNPMEGLEMPRGKRTQRSKPYITPEQFNSLIALMPDPMRRWSTSPPTPGSALVSW